MKKLILLTGVAILTLGACKNKKEVAEKEAVKTSEVDAEKIYYQRATGTI